MLIERCQGTIPRISGIAAVECPARQHARQVCGLRAARSMGVRFAQLRQDPRDVVGDLIVGVVHPAVPADLGELFHRGARLGGIVVRDQAQGLFAPDELPHAVGAEDERQGAAVQALLGEVDLLHVRHGREPGLLVADDVAERPRHVQAGVHAAHGEDAVVVEAVEHHAPRRVRVLDALALLVQVGLVVDRQVLGILDAVAPLAEDRAAVAHVGHPQHVALNLVVDHRACRTAHGRVDTLGGLEQPLGPEEALLEGYLGVLIPQRVVQEEAHDALAR
mmetsp:Transcript_8718/g.23327  ORF Transcript_8718/g.23327 Transcript_8718/m.23327 type:complete len:277 (+) Transcript_8718:83-913(+)